MQLQPQIRKLWLNFIKHTLNPFTRRLARSSFGPFSVIRHVGRRSGKHYETPLVVQPFDDGFVAALTYGPDVDWYKNVLAAGRCTLFRQGKEHVVDQIEPLDTETGRSAFPLPARLVLRAVGVRHFVKMTNQPRQTSSKLTGS